MGLPEPDRGRHNPPTRLGPLAALVRGLRRRTGSGMNSSGSVNRPSAPRRAVLTPVEDLHLVAKPVSASVGFADELLLVTSIEPALRPGPIDSSLRRTLNLVAIGAPGRREIAIWNVSVAHPKFAQLPDGRFLIVDGPDRWSNGKAERNAISRRQTARSTTRFASGTGCCTCRSVPPVAFGLGTSTRAFSGTLAGVGHTARRRSEVLAWCAGEPRARKFGNTTHPRRSRQFGTATP